MCLSLHSPAAEGAKTIRAAEIYTKGTRDEGCGSSGTPTPTNKTYIYTVGERFPLPQDKRAGAETRPYMAC